MIDTGDIDVSGLDVGKGEDHATAVPLAGKKAFGKRLPNTEPKLRELFAKLGLPSRRPISRRKSQKTSRRSWPCNSRSSTSKSTSSAAWKRKIANTSAVGQTLRSGHSASAGRDSTASPGAPAAPSLLRGTGTSSPSPRQDRGPPVSPPPRHPGHARPAATPSSPDRRNTSRHPTADQPPRHAAPAYRLDAPPFPLTKT